jgi:hypothetical protein
MEIYQLAGYEVENRGKGLQDCLPPHAGFRRLATWLAATLFSPQCADQDAKAIDSLTQHLGTGVQIRQHQLLTEFVGASGS